MFHLLNFNEPIYWEITTKVANYSTNNICEQICKEICNNGVDDDGDGLIDCEDDVDCPSPDLTIIVDSIFCNTGNTIATITVCNEGSLVMGPAIPIAIYSDDPTSTISSVILDTVILDTIFQLGDCISLSILLPAGFNNYYFIANDDGSLLLPFGLQNNFPSTDTTECDYLNNIATLPFNWAIPTLDIGPNVTVCDNGVTTFHVGPSWVDLIWHDRSKEEQFTGWEHGFVW